MGRHSVWGFAEAEVIIRRMIDAECTKVAGLWHAAKKNAYPYLVVEQARTLDDDVTFFTQKLLPRCDIWVAERRGQVVGFLAIQGSYVDRLFVLPSIQRCGIGTALINHAMKLSPNRIELHTHQKNLAARSFYEKHGFVAVNFGVSPAPESEPDVEYHWRPNHSKRPNTQFEG